jgi:uncharacterized membrane protein YhaH (DUF805 family)
MGVWVKQNFAWHGETRRDEYRRWVPLIVAADLVLLWAAYKFSRNGTINFGDFGLVGVPLFMAAILYFAGWLFLTARRLRSAGISRAWLIFACLTINLPIGGFHINVTMIAALLLTAVGASARDLEQERVL